MLAVELTKSLEWYMGDGNACERMISEEMKMVDGCYRHEDKIWN